MRSCNRVSLDATVPWNGCVATGHSGLSLVTDLQRPYPEYISYCQAACGVVLSVFKPTFPAIIPTPKNVFEGAVATHTDILAGVPAFIEV